MRALPLKFLKLFLIRFGKRGKLPAVARTVKNKPPTFDADVAHVVGNVRRRLAAIVESVCGGQPRAQDITDRFGVYRKLGWQIWNVVYAEDAVAAIKHLPNPRTLKVWNDAARKLGVTDQMLTRLDESIEEFNKRLEAHAPDRELLDMLVESRPESRDEATDARWRKQAFAGNAYTWGVRAKCMFAAAVLFPSLDRKDYFDIVRTQALYGLIRTRPGIRWPFAQLLIRNKDGEPFSFQREPLSPTSVVLETGVPLLEEFCSSPLPQVARKPGATPQMVEDELLPGAIGLAGAADIVTGEHLRAVAPAWADKPGETAMFGTGVRTPCELLVSDQLVHRSLYPNVRRELCVFGELMTQFSRDERDRLPMLEKVQHLGRASDGVQTADVPRYSDLLDLMIRASGCSADDFDVYRVRMRYPPLPVSIIVRHEMPMKPVQTTGEE